MKKILLLSCVIMFVSMSTFAQRRMNRNGLYGVPENTFSVNLSSGFYAVKKSDYRFSIYGFDRGHVCPSADRTQNQDDNSATFLMTNMIPQSPNCNRNVWKNLESYERSLAFSGKELYITAGAYGCAGRVVSFLKMFL